jgi:hypothetical protein
VDDFDVLEYYINRITVHSLLSLFFFFFFAQNYVYLLFVSV